MWERPQCSLCHCVNHCAFEHLKVGECWVMGGERQMTESASEVFVVETYVEFLTNAGFLTYEIEFLVAMFENMFLCHNRFGFCAVMLIF